jgi:uncharacterized membrane protein
MRKIWITCGWVLSVTGVVLVVMIGLAWLGGGETFKMISTIAMGCLFTLMGRIFIARGRSFPTYAPADGSGAARGDQAAAHRMIIQTIWIGGLIVLVVALVIGLWMFLVNPGEKP